MQAQTRQLWTLDGQDHIDVRDYQQELLEAAKFGNIIAFLETGSGKTLISALLAKKFLASHKRIVMLVPTKLLVPQQAGLFRNYVAENIGEYTGDRGVDVWTPKQWEEEIRNHKILIMTPKILDDLLMCGNFRFRDISLLIFDEAHHCSKGHPYAQIMRKYAEVPRGERPRVFGMTASPVNTNVKSREQLLSSIAALEQLMDCKLVTIHDEQLQKLQQTVPMPETDSFEFTIPTFSTQRNQMITFAVQQLLRDQAAVLQKLLELTRQHENLRRKVAAFEGVAGSVVSLDDRGPLNRAENVGDWLVNKLCFALLHQGPFCAALVLQDYFRNCSSDGRLSTLGTVGAETEFYAAAKAAMTGRTRRTPGVPPPPCRLHAAPGSAAHAAAAEDLRALQHRIAQELPELAGERMPPAEESLRGALLHAVLLCLRMLVSDPVLADCLSAQALKLLFDREPAPAAEAAAARGPAKAAPAAAFVDTNMHAVAAVLDAALHAVPTDILQACVLQGPEADLAAAWSQHMLCDLVTDKVSRAVAHLYNAGIEAQGGDPDSKWASLVFAERQSCSVAMDLLVKRIPALAAVLRTGTLKSSNALMSNAHQGDIIARFRSGALNALFCTSVAEEGLDIQQCSLVICYDVPKRPLSMVQTVGRARSRGSRVFFMRAMQASGKKAQENMEQMAQYTQQMRRAVMAQEAVKELHTPQRPLAEMGITLGDKAINAGRARSMLSQYVQALAHWKGRWQDLLRSHKSADRRTRELRDCQPRYSTRRLDGDGVLQWQVTLHLPASSPLRHVAGDLCASHAAAKDSAVLRGIRALWEQGVFGENLRPTPPKDLLDLEQEVAADDENPHEWRARQTLRRPQRFTVKQQPPLHLDLRHAPLDEAAAISPCCFVATRLHLYAFDMAPEGGAGAGGSSGGGPAGGLRMCLGLLLLQELPELPKFPVYEAPREEGQPPMVYGCRLQYCRTLDLSMEQVVKTQRFHCKMVQAARGNRGMPDPVSPEGTTEAISNETWVESSGGAFYVIVPVCKASSAAGKAQKRDHGASPRAGDPLELDERSIESALHPSAQDDRSAEQLHAQIVELLQQRLDPAATEAQQEELQGQMEALLAGRVLSTLHRPSIAYRFRGFSTCTIGDRFPDDRQGQYNTYLEYYTKRYGYKAALFDPRAPLLRATTASSAVKDINCLVPPRPQAPGAAAAVDDPDPAADDAAVDPEGVPIDLADSPTAAGTSARMEAARTGLARAALDQGSERSAQHSAQQAQSSAEADVIDLVSSDEGSDPDVCVVEEMAAAADGGGGATAAGGGSGGAAAAAEPRRHHEVLLPLELCRVHRLKEELLQSLQFLPALLYRIEGLLAAHEVWQRLTPAWMPHPVKQPAFTLKVLEALTPQGTRDAFDSERYELLGDGVLKGMAARHVYLTAGRGATEGHMSLHLCRLVSNGTLHRAAVWTKDVRSKHAPAYTPSNRDQRSITESVRAFPYGRPLWRPPGFEQHFVPEVVTLAGKKSADALEALIGVVFEAAGEAATEAWLAYLGILPGHTGEPCLRFLKDVKAAAVAAVAAARAMPRARLTGQTGKEATLPVNAQLQRSAGRDEQPHRAAQGSSKAEEESAEDIAKRVHAERRRMPRESWLVSQFAPVPPVNVAQEKVQQKLRAIIGEPEMLLQMNAALQDAPRDLPRPTMAPPEILKPLHSHLWKGGWQHVAQQRRAAERLAASTMATTAKTFRPRELQQGPESTVESILGYTFKDKDFVQSCVIHSSFVHEAGEQDRLEFLGDAMLGTCVTAFLFYCLGADHRKEVQPEQLHNLRALLVQNDTLAFMAVYWGLDRHLRHSSTRLGNAINAFKALVQEKLAEKEQHPEGRSMGIMQYLLTAGGWDTQTMDHPKALGDILEASLGAVTLDCDFDMPQILQVVLKVLDGLRGVSPEIVPRHPVSVLHEVISKLLPTVLPKFEYIGEDPPAGAADDTAADAQAEVVGHAYVMLPGGAPGAPEVQRDISGRFRGASRRKVKALCAEDALRRLAENPGLLKLPA